MATKITIISDALIELGAKPITTLTESQVAIDAGRLYDITRDQVQRDHPWRFLRARAELDTPIVTAPAFDWLYHFNLPADCIRVWQVGTKDRPIDYELEFNATLAVGNILTNVTPVPIVYSKAFTDETYFPLWFVYLMQSAMKARLAYRVTNSQSVAAAAKEEFVDLLRRERAIQGTEVLPEEVGGASEWLAARY